MKKVALWVAALATLLGASGVSAQMRGYPGLVGYGYTTLLGASSGTICSVTSMSDDSTTAGSFRQCINNTQSSRVDVIVFTEAPGCVFQIGGAGQGELVFASDSVIVAGGTCAAGEIHYRTLSHALAGAAPGILVDSLHHIILSDVSGWDEECTSNPCSPDEQKQMRFTPASHGVLQRFFMHGNSGDDVMQGCSSAFVSSSCDSVTITDGVRATTNNTTQTTCGLGGKGRWWTIHWMLDIQCGHRSLTFNYDTIHVRNYYVGGSGGRSFEATGVITAHVDNSALDNGIWPKDSDHHAEIFRFRENVVSGGTDSAVAHGDTGAVQIYYDTTIRIDTIIPGDSGFVANVTGNDVIDLLFGYGSRCANGTDTLANGCTHGSRTVDTADVLSRTPVVTSFGIEPEAVSVDSFLARTLEQKLVGPRYLWACDGQVIDSTQHQPADTLVLHHALQQRSPPGNAHPSSVATWYPSHSYPDTTSAGLAHSCGDVDGDGMWDSLEMRLTGSGTDSTSKTWFSDTDGDNYPDGLEVFISLTDPLAFTADDGGSFVSTWGSGRNAYHCTYSIDTIIAEPTGPGDTLIARRAPAGCRGTTSMIAVVVNGGLGDTAAILVRTDTIQDVAGLTLLDSAGVDALCMDARYTCSESDLRTRTLPGQEQDAGHTRFFAVFTLGILASMVLLGLGQFWAWLLREPECPA